MSFVFIALVMSVDKFGRHLSGVKVRRETQRNLPYRLTEDGNIDVENKIIHNLGEPNTSKDAVTLSYVQDHCLLLLDGNTVDVKGRRVTSVADPQETTDAVNKGYVDKNRIKLGLGAWTFDNFALSNVGEPLMGNDAVNVKFMRENTVNLRNDVFTALGKRITNVAAGSESNDVANLQQLNDLKRFAEGEIYKINSIWRYHIDKLYNKIRQPNWRSSEDVEESLWTHAPELIQKYDKEADSMKDWRTVYDQEEIAPPTLLEPM